MYTYVCVYVCMCLYIYIHTYIHMVLKSYYINIYQKQYVIFKKKTSTQMY